MASPNAIATDTAARRWPILRLTGTVQAASRREAMRLAEEEMEALVGLLAVATAGTFDQISGICVAPADSPSRAGPRTDGNYTPIVPITEDEVESMTLLCNWWRDLRNEHGREAVRRSLAWYREAAWTTHRTLRTILLWTAAEALAQGFPVPQAQRRCERCQQPLTCAGCGHPSPPTEGYATASGLLVDRYGAMSRSEYSEFSRGRGGPGDGGRAPSGRRDPTMPRLMALRNVIVRALHDLAVGR